MSINFGGEKLTWINIIILSALLVGCIVGGIINNNRQPEVRLIGVNALIDGDGKIKIEYVIKNFGKTTTGPIEMEYELKVDGGNQIAFSGRDFTWFLKGGEKVHIRVNTYAKFYVKKSVQFEMIKLVWGRVSINDRKFLKD